MLYVFCFSGGGGCDLTGIDCVLFSSRAGVFGSCYFRRSGLATRLADVPEFQLPLLVVRICLLVLHVPRRRGTLRLSGEWAREKPLRNLGVFNNKISFCRTPGGITKSRRKAKTSSSKCTIIRAITEATSEEVSRGN